MIFSHNGRPIQKNSYVFDIQSGFAYQVPWSWCLPCSDPALEADQRPIHTRAMPLLGGNGQYHGFLPGLDCQTFRCSSFPVVLLVLLPSLLFCFRCLTLFDRWVIIKYYIDEFAAYKKSHWKLSTLGVRCREACPCPQWMLAWAKPGRSWGLQVLKCPHSSRVCWNSWVYMSMGLHCISSVASFS